MKNFRNQKGDAADGFLLLLLMTILGFVIFVLPYCSHIKEVELTDKFTKQEAAEVVHLDQLVKDLEAQGYIVYRYRHNRNDEIEVHPDYPINSRIQNLCTIRLSARSYDRLVLAKIIPEATTVEKK